MPKAKHKETPEAEVQKLIDAGELSPIEAEAALDKIVRHQHKEGP